MPCQSLAGHFSIPQGIHSPPSPWESLAKNMIRERQAPLKGKNNGVGEREEPGWTGPHPNIAPAPSPPQHLQPYLSLPVSFSSTAPKESAKFTHFQRSKPPRCRLSRWTFTIGRHNALPLGTHSHPHVPSLTYRLGSSSSRQGDVRLNPPVRPHSSLPALCSPAHSPIL